MRKNAANTMSGVKMRSFLATTFGRRRAEIHPALRSFAAECRGTLAYLFVYVGTLALLALFAVHFWDELSRDVPAAIAAGWLTDAQNPRLRGAL